MKQVSALVNDVTKQFIGEIGIKTENTDFVDVGKNVLSSDTAKEQFMSTLANRIGQDIYVGRTYDSIAPDFTNLDWQGYGSVLSKVRINPVKEAENNPTWDFDTMDTDNDLWTYNPPECIQYFYNKKTTFEIPVTKSDIQIRESFTSPEKLEQFWGNVSREVENSLQLKYDTLKNMTLANFIGEKIHKNSAVIDTLAMYNTEYGTELTADKAMGDKNYLRYTAYIMLLYRKRMMSMSKLFNVSSYPTFSREDDIRTIVLDNFAQALEVFLQSDTYHNELVKLPNYKSIPYWQGSGTDFSFDNVSKIDVTLASDSTTNVKRNHIIGVMVDKWGIMVNNDFRRTPVSYNPRREMLTMYYKSDVSYCNDLSENGIIFVCGAGNAT